MPYNRTRSTAVSKKADRTAYNERYSCTEPNRQKCRLYGTQPWSRDHDVHGRYSRRGNLCGLYIAGYNAHQRVVNQDT